MRPLKTVLCVYPDDVQMSLRAMVLETRGFSVLRAANGADALLMLEKAGPLAIDALVADFRLPDMTAADLAWRTKELQPEVRVMITVDSPPAVMLLVEESPVDAFLPYRTLNAEFVERLRILTARKRGPKPLQKRPVQGVVETSAIRRFALAAAAEKGVA